MGKPDGLSRRSEEEKSGMEAQFFNEGQLIDLEQYNDNAIGEGGTVAENVEMEGIDVARWEKRDELWVPSPGGIPTRGAAPAHDSQVAGHWGRLGEEPDSGAYITQFYMGRLGRECGKLRGRMREVSEE